MSASNEWSERHLTPRGWEAGSEKLDMSSNIVAPPSDRVLTHCSHSHMSSGFSPVNNWCDETMYAVDADQDRATKEATRAVSRLPRSSRLDQASVVKPRPPRHLAITFDAS